MNLGLYVVQLLLFPAFHFMTFFKDFLVSSLSYIFFLFICPESIFISVILIQMYSAQH